MLKYLSFHLSFVACLFSVSASELPVSVTLNENNSHIEAVLNIAPGWTVYGPSSAVPNTQPFFTWVRAPTGTPYWLEEKKWDENGVDIYGYKTHARFILPISPPGEEASNIRGTLSLVVCNLTTCMPVVVEIVWPDPTELPFLYIFLISILAGFLLNAMPCMLPILSIKIIPLLNTRKKQDRWGIVAFVCGSFTFFMMFAFMTFFMRLTGKSAGWGMHFQSPYFLTFFVWVLTVFSARFFGLLNFSSILVSRPESRYVYGQNFLEGLVLALVATPCAGPFLGTAAGFALSQDLLISMSIFSTIWLGFSIPYLMLLAAPSVLEKFLPKPGPWLHVVEKGFGGLMAISCLWFLWVLYSATNAMIVVSVMLGLLLMLLLIQRYPAHQSTLVGLSLFICLLPALDQELLYDDSVAVFEEAISFQEAAQKRHQTTLVNITAAWCLTCQANKLILKMPEIETLFEINDVHQVTYDWTRRDPSIREFIHRYGRDGIPFSIVFSPDYPEGVVLPEILTWKALSNVLQKTPMPT